ncbi:MAG: tetratricopeptide repeat protein [Thermodesulfobacteriota bacterium]
MTAATTILLALGILASGPAGPSPALAQESLPIPDEYRPLSAEQWLDKGLSYLERKDFSRAVDAFSKAIGKKPSLVDAYIMRGITYGQHQDRQDLALADFTKALELDPRNSWAYDLRGATWVSKGELDRALEDFNKALELNPGNAQIYYNRGQTWKAKGDLDQAIQDVRMAISITSDRPEYHQALAELETLKAQQAPEEKKVQQACFIGASGE